MASITLDRKTRWWSVRYLAAPGRRVRKTLCKHDGPLPRPGKAGRITIPTYVRNLAAPWLELERRVKVGQAPPAPTGTDLGGYFSQYLDAFAASHPARTVRSVRRAAAAFLDYCKAEKVGHLQAVDPATCRKYLNERRAGTKAGRAIAASTAKTERGYLTPIFSVARADGLIDRNPWEFVKVEGKPRDEAPTFWTAEELTKLLAVLAGWHRDWVLLACNTGIRASALLGLRWSEVHWDRGLIHIKASASKSGRFYEVPLSAVAHDVLARRLAESRSALVFESTIPGRPYASQTSYAAIKKAVKKAGIPDHGDYNHVLRRSFATAAIDRGIPLAVVSRWLGHSSIRTTQVYIGYRAEDHAEHMAGFGLGSASPSRDVSPPPPPDDRVDGPVVDA